MKGKRRFTRDEGVAMRVLVIEDDSDTVDFVSQVVRGRWPAAVVRGFWEGEDGLRALEATHADVLLLDIGLPDMDGWQVLERLRQFSDIPVVIMTGLGQSQDVVSFVRGSADQYVTKPFSPNALVESIEAAMESGGRRGATRDRDPDC